jgi:hypothetical protein
MKVIAVHALIFPDSEVAPGASFDTDDYKIPKADVELMLSRGAIRKPAEGDSVGKAKNERAESP